jgi:4-diphosphocytidyl-2-C-methyl-D-erythritol kinase
VLRAAELLRTTAGCSEGAELVLEKGIPVQAGLGGGSSDAAAALVLCRAYWGIDLPDAHLHELGAKLGADVPFFLQGGTARGRGRGDRIEALPPLRESALLLGFPPYGIPTGAVFGQVVERLTLPGNGVSLPPLSAHKWPEGNDFSFAVNDLERVVFPDRPELEQFRDTLLDGGAAAALLSGSGSTVFGVFPSRRGLDELARFAQARFAGWRVVTSRTVPEAVRWVE